MRHRDGVRRNAPCIRSSLMPCSGLPCLRATLTISTMTYRFDSGLPSAKSAAAKTAALLRSFHDGLAYDFECSIPELETKLQALAWATARHTLPELFHLCIPRPRGISTVRKVDHLIVDLERVSRSEEHTSELKQLMSISYA